MRTPSPVCGINILDRITSVRLHAANDLRVESIPAPGEPGPNDVIVRVAFAGVCGSDLHNFATGQWITRAPSVAGHEFSGRVERVGSAVVGFEIGDLVVIDSRFTCGVCLACRDGKPQVCETLGFVGEAIDGGFAELATVPARLLVKAAPTAALDVLALAEPLAVALHAIHRLGVRPHDPVLIIGCGPIGALSALVASQASNQPVTVVDRNAERANYVASLIDGETASASASFPTVSTDGQPIRRVLDTTGSTAVIKALVEQFTAATIALVGIGSGEIALDPVHLVEREIALVGCHAFEDELDEAASRLQRDPEFYRPVIGQQFELDEAERAYAYAASGQGQSIKTLFRIGGHA